MYASLNDDIAMVQHLAEAGADMDAKDKVRECERQFTYFKTSLRSCGVSLSQQIIFLTSAYHVCTGWLHISNEGLGKLSPCNCARPLQRWSWQRCEEQCKWYLKIFGETTKVNTHDRRRGVRSLLHLHVLRVLTGAFSLHVLIIALSGHLIILLIWL